MESVPADDSGVVRSAEVLDRGGTIVYPTDTLYGLGASIRHPEAIARIFSLKRRPVSPQSVIMADLEMARAFVELSDLADDFFRKFPAGPFTFLLPVRGDAAEKLPGSVVRNGKLGIRIPLHPFPRRLVRRVGPITSTSANVHGERPPKDFKEIRLRGADLYINDGPCRYGKPSTIISEEGDRIVIVRMGALEPSAIDQYLGGHCG